MVTLFIELFVRSAIILGSAELLQRCLRRGSPAARCIILRSSFILLFLWPLLSILLPEYTFAIGLADASHEHRHFWTNDVHARGQCAFGAKLVAADLAKRCSDLLAAPLRGALECVASGALS